MAAGLAIVVSQVWAQGVGFLTEQERLASYCAGVSEARMRELDEFLKNKCAGSDRKECRDSIDELARAQRMDRGYGPTSPARSSPPRSRGQGPKEKALSQRWRAVETIG
jgi:hypothetical protein